MSQDTDLQLDNLVCINLCPILVSCHDTYPTKDGDTTGTLWRPKNLAQVRERRTAAGKRFFKAFKLEKGV
jgi:hypothetical protein